MSILIKQPLILTMERENGALKSPFRGDILVEGDSITHIGATSVYEESTCEQVIDGRHLLAMPGLINTHSHAAMTLFRGFGDDLTLMDWLQNKIWPAEGKMTPTDILLGTRLAILEMIKSGTTAFADMYDFCDQVVEAVAEAGGRASICRGIVAFTPEMGAQKLEQGLAFALHYRGVCAGRVTTMLGPHAPYTCSPDFLAHMAELGREHKLPLHIHLLETQDEIAQIAARDGCRPVELLERCDFFRDNKVLAAHGVWLNEEEISSLSGYDVSVAHCPASNFKLASGIAPVNGLLAAGVNVALGTDSACSNNSLDLFEEMKLAALVAKVRGLDPLALPAATALEMATVNGAKALGLAGCGLLAAGNKADIILVNIDQPHFTPQHDLISHLVYAAGGSDVDTVLVAGRVLMHKRELTTLDEERIIYEAEHIAQELCYRR
ncbi:MAG: amidohydrolase [Firmicutes bacterium]|nr:amidohydrolase [Bacillota bacterium]